MNISQIKSKKEIQSIFKESLKNGKVNKYKKIGNVLARKAKKGEKIITIIDGEKETENVSGENDMVVESTGKNKEKYIISKEKFDDRYVFLKKISNKGDYDLYKPTGYCYAFKYNGPSIYFEAPWGEKMLLKNNDYLASSTLEHYNDIYRIEKKSFKESYEIVEKD